MRPSLLALLAVFTSLLLFAQQRGVRKTLRSAITGLIPLTAPRQLALPYPAPPPQEEWQTMNPTARLSDVHSRLLPKLHDELTAKQLQLGQSAFIRIFKETHELELWLMASNHAWRLFRNYPIATFSGTLGPKTKEGDMQAPEGFYTVTPRQLNPASSYHLSFNIGYPNAYDLAHQRTGSLIMVHGSKVSIGCFAMTDPLIEEIYLIVEAALKTNRAVPIHIFPFRMTDERMQKAEGSPHLDFWQSLRPSYVFFENDRRIPQITVENGIYRVH